MFDALLGDLYRTIEDPAAWTPFLSALCAATNTDNAALILQDLKTGENVTIGCHIAPEEMERYRTTYARLNPWMPAADQVAPEGMVLRPDFLPLEQLRKTQFYREWGKKNQVVHTMAVNLGLQAGRFTFLSVNSGEQRGAISDQAAVILAALAPHVGRVVRLQSALAHAASVTEALNRTAGAVFFVSAQGQLLEATSAAEEVLRRGDTLRLDHTRSLSSPDTAAHEQLATAIARAGKSASTRYQVVALSGGHLAVVTRVQASAGQLLTRRHQRMVLLVLPQSGARSVELFAPLFGLTAAETRLMLELVNARSLTAAARALGISRETAKCQLKNIFAKTGTRRQAELMRVFCSLGVITHEPTLAAGTAQA